jgi:glycosyltransferase involved in cell wall biosynthesis
MLMSPRARIGIYCPGDGTGGPWRYAHSLLSGVDLNEFEVIVFWDLEGNYSRRPEIKTVCLSDGGIDCASRAPSLPRPRVAGNRSLLRRLVPSSVRLWSGFGRQTQRLARLLRSQRLDLLHTNNTGCEESPVAARVAGVPQVIGTFHVDSTYDLHRERSGPRHRILEVISNRCLDRAIAVSQATKFDWVRRTHIPARRVTTIYNGVDTEKFRRRVDRLTARKALALPVDSRLIVGGLGRLDEAKGFTYLIDAVARLAPDYPDLLLVIAGDGPLRAELERQAAERGIGERVRLLGFQRDVQMVLDALDVFTLPSLCEALPYALLEAMATELPCVGADVGGVAEIIVQHETGFIVRPRSAVELEASLRLLLGSREHRARMGEAGRRRVVNHFQEREMVQKTIELYRQLIARRRDRLRVG